MIDGKAVADVEESGSKKRKAKDQEGESSSTDDSDLTTQTPDGYKENVPAQVNDDGNQNESGHSPTTEKRKKVWSKMLDKFPQNGDAESKSEWLAQVLVVSDKDTSRKELRADIVPQNDTREMAAEFLRSATKPRKKKHSSGKVETENV